MSITAVTPIISGDQSHLWRQLRPKKWVPLVDICRQTKEYSQIHSSLIKLGLIHNTLLSTRLLSSLALSFSPTNISYAHQLFDQDPESNTFCFNVLIRAYSKTRHHLDALTLFVRMLSTVVPNSMTFPFLLNSCSSLPTGRQLHALSIKFGLQDDLYVNNSLMSMYSTSSSDALKVFDTMLERDIVSWNIVVSALASAGMLTEARDVF